jgi:hypothetical protein
MGQKGSGAEALVENAAHAKLADDGYDRSQR